MKVRIFKWKNALKYVMRMVTFSKFLYGVLANVYVDSVVEKSVLIENLYFLMLNNSQIQ